MRVEDATWNAAKDDRGCRTDCLFLARGGACHPALEIDDELISMTDKNAEVALERTPDGMPNHILAEMANKMLDVTHFFA